MAHLNAYDSFQTKKSKMHKRLAIEKSANKKNILFDDTFLINKADEFGVVIEVRYNDAFVLNNGEVVCAKLRPDLNMVCNQTIFPGDHVILDKTNTIIHLISRTTLLSRVKKDSTRLNEFVGSIKNLAANINLAVIVVAAQEPPLHPKFIDRYLMILKNSNIPAIIVLNKCELKTDKDEEILNIYRSINIPVVETSTIEKRGIVELKKYLKGKQTIFVGNSGVGKSSLTNAIMDSDEIRTSHVSDKSKRGRHTTTSSKYYIWDNNSSIIDTPGIRSLDVSSFSPIEIQEYFPEFNPWKNKCKYNDCLHTNEPFDVCLVKQGVASGFISKDRYESYLRIITSFANDNDYKDILADLDNEIKKYHC